MDLRTTVVIAVVLTAAIPGGVGTAAAQDDTSCSFPFSAVDATGTEVTIDEDPDRIVTLAPSAAQTMWEIGAEEEVVGVSKFSSYLEGASEKENVSGGGRQNVVAEKVVALEPDLVLAPNIIDNDTVAQLRDAGLTVYRFDGADSIDFVIEKTRFTGALVGHCEGADETAAWIDGRIGTVREAVEGEERPNVLYSFFGFTVNEGTFIHEMITTAGGENVAANADLQGPYPQISNEIVANSTVDWLLLNSDAPTVPDNEAYNNTRAVEEGNVLVLEANYISQPAPRIVYPIVKMAEAFHPEAYAEANTTATPTPEATETDAETTERTETATEATDAEAGTPTSTPEADPTTTEAPGQPGFGIAPAVFALVAILLAARAR